MEPPAGSIAQIGGVARQNGLASAIVTARVGCERADVVQLKRFSVPSLNEHSAATAPGLAIRISVAAA